MPNEQDRVDHAAFKKRFDYQPQSLAGKGVVVTGGTTGIGRAAVMLLLARGANVLTFGRRKEQLEEAMAEFKAIGGGEIYGLQADVSDERQVDQVFEEADRRLGQVDVLINNAAVAAGSMMDDTPEQWRQAININLLGYLLCARAAADRMKPRQSGTIVNIGSMSAESRSAGGDLYVLTKSGIRGFSDSLAKQLNEDAIRVLLIEPGLVGADMVDDDMSEADKKKKHQAMTMLMAEELAHCIVYCLEQPQRCSLSMVQIRPTRQDV